LHTRNFPVTHVTRNSDTRITITVPAYVNYSASAMGMETVSSLDLPSEALQSTTDLTAFAGSFTVDIRARTVIYSGTLYAKNENDDGKIRGSGDPFTIVIDLFGDVWQPTIATDPALRYSLVVNILLSNKNYTEAGYEKAMLRMRDSLRAPDDSLLLDSLVVGSGQGFTDVVRYNSTRVILTFPVLKDYQLPGGGAETFTVQDLPSSLTLGSLSENLIRRVGKFVVRIIPRTVEYSGTFFTGGVGGIDEATSKTDEDMRSSTTYTIIARTINDTWAMDVATDPIKRNTVVRSILHSDKDVTDPGYANALHKQLDNFPASNVVRHNHTHLAITVPSFPNYTLFAMAVEQIRPTVIPTICVNSTTDMTAQLGLFQLRIYARTAVLSGSFFTFSAAGIDEHSDHSIQNAVTYTVVIDLIGDTWVANVTSDSTLRQLLINSIFLSNRASTDLGYQNAFRTVIQNYQQANVNLTSAHRLSVTVPSFPAYDLFPGATETIQTGDMPHALLAGWGSGGELRGTTDIALRSGPLNITVVARTIHYSGTFFSTSPKNDENIQDATTYTIIMTCLGDKWQAPASTPKLPHREFSA